MLQDSRSADTVQHALPTYDGKDLTFEIPEGWADRSVLAFAPAPKPKKAASPSFVVTREPIEEGETLRTFAARQLSHMATGLKEFKLRHNRDVDVSGAPAVQYEFSWAAPNGTIVQRITMALHETSVILFTASAPLALASGASELFDRVLASVQLRATKPSTPTSSAPPPRPTSSAPPSRGADADDPPTPASLSPDPDDDYLIALARAGKAHVIVSGDAHLKTF
jgi:hypothetical protein